MSMVRVFCCSVLLIGCGQDVPDVLDSGLTGEGVNTEPATGSGPTASETIVTFTTYTDADCTELPPLDSVVVLDTTVACNETPDSSISELVCYADKITYTNHPNSADCTADGIFNELPVGVCTEFPGPVPTWKYIEPDTYACDSGA